MKTKHFIKIITSLLVLTLSSFSIKLFTKEDLLTNKFETKRNLALYGRHIFDREGCIKCHTLIQTENKELVSLDGMQGKYANGWHYIHLTDPKAMVYDSKMPSYEFLNNNALSKDTFALLSDLDIDSKWMNLLQQADSITGDLKNLNIDVNPKSEILAIIAYLNTIPQSEELKKNYSIKIQKQVKEEKAWDSLIQNFSSIIYQTKGSGNSIESGRAIFKANCFPCHGNEGGGGIGPNLIDKYWLHGGDIMSITKTIVYGVPEKGMMSWRFSLSPTQIGEVVAYIKSIKGTKPKNSKMKQGKKE